jgi:hypothetical protein
LNSASSSYETEFDGLLSLAETDADLDYIDTLIAARERADTTTAAQKVTLEQLTQQAAAHLLCVTTRHLRDHQPARNRDGTYHGPDIVQWALDRAIADAKERWNNRSNVSIAAKDRQALARAIKLEEEAKGVQGTYVKLADVKLEFMAMAADVRTELESLPKLMANDFPAELRDTLLLELKGQVRQILRRLANRGKRLDSAE